MVAYVQVRLLTLKFEAMLVSYKMVILNHCTEADNCMHWDLSRAGAHMNFVKWVTLSRGSNLEAECDPDDLFAEFCARFPRWGAAFD